MKLEKRQKAGAITLSVYALLIGLLFSPIFSKQDQGLGGADGFIDLTTWGAIWALAGGIAIVLALLKHPVWSFSVIIGMLTGAATYYILYSAVVQHEALSKYVVLGLTMLVLAIITLLFAKPGTDKQIIKIGSVSSDMEHNDVPHGGNIERRS